MSLIRGTAINNRFQVSTWERANERGWSTIAREMTNVSFMTLQCRTWRRWVWPLAAVLFTTLSHAGWFGNDCAGQARAAQAQANDVIDWKIGLEFRQAMDHPLGLKWGENPARQALRNLSQNQRLAIWLDRRIDPGLKLQFESDDLPLGITLDKLCEKYRWGRAQVGPVIYIGPNSSVEHLATLAAVRRQQVGRESPQARARWARAVVMKIPELSQPRELALELVREAGATLENPQAIPHDLWPEIQLPPLTLADRLTLVLAGFDLTFEQSTDGQTIRLVPAPHQLEYEETYSWRGQNQSLAAQLAKKFPEAKIELVNDKVLVRGKYEVHELIDRMMSGETVRTVKVAPGSKVYSLRVDNQPAGKVVKTVAGELGKEMKYDPALIEKLKTNVSFNAKDVPLEKLLTQVLEPLGLTYEIKEASLEILPAKP